MHEELKARLRDLIADNNWAGNHIAVPSLEAIEQLERQLADRDAEIAKLIQAIADHVTVRAEQYAELQKYRDAPVVAWVEVVDSYEGPYHFNGEKLLNVGKHKLIVKPGENK